MIAPLINSWGGFSQIGMVVRDFDQAIHHMTTILGIGPFYVMRDFTIEDYWFRGERSPPPQISMGIAQAGPIQIEVISQHNDAPSGYGEFLATGREGYHHLSVWLDSHESYWNARQQMLGANFLLVHESRSMTAGRFAFFETKLPGQCVVELSEGLTPQARQVIETVRDAAVEWDGRSDPVRAIA